MIKNIFLKKDIDVNGIEDNILKKMLRKMLLIRMAENKISENVESGKIKCPCHLAIGQEAIATAVALVMKKSDSAFGAHRSHSHFLALNEDTYSLFAEVLGKFDGSSRGMGGSMHVVDKKNGFMGSVPIVGATIPIATGAALAAKMNKANQISISYFGDGACEEGVFHESLNMASVMELPVLFICENNLFSSHLHISQRQPSISTARFANSHLIKSSTNDGNDIATLYKLLNAEISKMRANSKPFFLETYTYRWKGHVGHRDDIDVGVKRNDDLTKWKTVDPIERLKKAMIVNEIITQDDYDALITSLKKKIEDDWSKADLAKYPENKFLTKPVYNQ